MPLIVAAIGMLLCATTPAKALVLGNMNATTSYQQVYGVPGGWINDSQGANLMDAYGTASASATTAGFGGAMSQVEMLNSTSPGTVGAKSDILGNNYLPENISNMSNVGAFSNWLVSSSTLGAGDDIHLSFTARFEGKLSAKWLDGSTAAPASVSATASGRWEYGTGFFSHAGGGYGAVTLNAGATPTPSQGWSNGTSIATPDGSYNWTVEMPVEIDTKVGDILSLRLNLSSMVSAIGPTLEPYKAYALSDFSNTGSFIGIPLTGDTYLVRTDEVVPEPGSAAALGLMMAGLVPTYLRGRKRRS